MMNYELWFIDSCLDFLDKVMKHYTYDNTVYTCAEQSVFYPQLMTATLAILLVVRFVHTKFKYWQEGRKGVGMYSLL